MGSSLLSVWDPHCYLYDLYAILTVICMRSSLWSAWDALCYLYGIVTVVCMGSSLLSVCDPHCGLHGIVILKLGHQFHALLKVCSDRNRSVPLKCWCNI